MKALLASLVLASAAAVAQQAAPEPTLKPGSQVPVDALASAKWIQGGPLKELEAGKVYLFECWATWCGPCIAAIPHVNDLHRRYHEKGLRVYGINVWEDGEDKVAKFVKDKGEGMSYPVAYTGKGSAFEQGWLKAAGVRGIPHAFIVRDGKLLLTAHPSQLTDKAIEALLSGEDGAKTVAAEIRAATEAREKTSSLVSAFRKAASQNQADEMAAKVDELEKLDPASPYLQPMKLEVLTARKDWDGATTMLKAMPEGPQRSMALAMNLNKIARAEGAEYPPTFVNALLEVREDSKMPASSFDLVMVSIIHAKAGNKDKALEYANKAAENAKANEKPGTRSMPAAPFERYAKEVADGKQPTLIEVQTWVSEAMRGIFEQAAQPARPAQQAKP